MKFDFDDLVLLQNFFFSWIGPFGSDKKRVRDSMRAYEFFWEATKCEKFVLHHLPLMRHLGAMLKSKNLGFDAIVLRSSSFTG